MTLSKVSRTDFSPVTYNAQTLEDFDEWIDKTSKKTGTTIFRGQRKNYPLLPNICRGGEPESLLINERALLTEFQQEAKICLQVVPTTDWEWLVVAQHHGLHTRLIDWSYDPYVALWFALEKCNKNPDSKPEVWIMNTLKEDVIDNLESSRPFNGSRTKVFHSSFRIPRLVAQKGCFVLFKHFENSSKGFVPLEKNQKLRKRIGKVQIQKHSIKTIMAQLHAMNYKKDILFPDIDKVAKRVQSRVLGQVQA